MAGIDDETHKRILGMIGNDYSWTGITNTMLIQLDKDDTKGVRHNPTSSSSFSTIRTKYQHGYEAEYEDEEDGDFPGSLCSSVPASTIDESEDLDILMADVDEFESALEAIDIQELDEDEAHAFAQEVQSL